MSFEDWLERVRKVARVLDVGYIALLPEWRSIAGCVGEELLKSALLDCPRRRAQFSWSDPWWRWTRIGEPAPGSVYLQAIAELHRLDLSADVGLGAHPTPAAFCRWLAVALEAAVPAIGPAYERAIAGLRRVEPEAGWFKAQMAVRRAVNEGSYV